MEHECDTDETVAREVDARIDHTAISLASNDSVLLLHRVGDIHFADLREKQRRTKLLRYVAERRSRREVRDYRSFFAAEHIQRCEHERIVFADRLTSFRDDREAVGV